MLNEDFSLRFSWYAQERTAKAKTNTPGFCHQKGSMMDQMTYMLSLTSLCP